MSSSALRNTSNHLLAKLPGKARSALLAICQPVQLQLSEILFQPGERARYVYLPTTSCISLVTHVDGHPGVEVGMVGNEGMLGAHLVLGVSTTPLQALVQAPGAAWCIGRAAFMAELAQSPSLRRVLNRYLYVLMVQLATSSACVRYHQVGPRLARWLLMSQDRAEANQFHMTQEFLAAMLGVRRVGVTAAAGDLQRSGLIEYRRGTLTVLDREGLKAVSCSCYATNQQTYASVLG